MNEGEKTATTVTMAPSPRLLRKAKLAAELEVGKRTIEKWTSEGILQPIRIGRVLLFEWNETAEQLRKYGLLRKEGAKKSGGGQ